MIFEKVFQQSFFMLFKISGLFANLPENLETARSMKNVTEVFKKFFK